MSISKNLAKEIAARPNIQYVVANGYVREKWDVVRELVDIRTGGSLDATQLDLLTDWVIEAVGGLS